MKDSGSGMKRKRCWQTGEGWLGERARGNSRKCRGRKQKDKESEGKKVWKW